MIIMFLQNLQGYFATSTNDNVFNIHIINDLCFYLFTVSCKIYADPSLRVGMTLSVIESGGKQRSE
jgi:hypothetical protein